MRIYQLYAAFQKTIILEKYSTFAIDSNHQGFPATKRCADTLNQKKIFK
jgi:hypothetical protein